MEKLKMLVLLAIFVVVSAVVSAESVLVSKKVDQAPEVNGIAESVWDSAISLNVTISKVPMAITMKNRELQEGKKKKLWDKEAPHESLEVVLKSVHTDSEIFFLAEWPDKSKDDQHKTYHWNKEKEEYVKGKEREDRFVFSFSISGEFDASMISSKEQVNDVWHWKAARTNPAGIAHDKSHIITKTKPVKKAGTHYLADGTPVYILRPGDGGKSPYKSTSEFNGKEFDELEYMGVDDIPAYQAFVPDAPDAADVKAKGVWADDKWTLEIGRKLKTGFDKTDVQFNVPSEVGMAVAAFDHVGDQLHLTSKKLILKIE